MKIKILPEDKKWSQLVRERDMYSCQVCGRSVPQWKVEAHHIRPRGRWSTRLLLENGITLCVMCHKFGPDAVHQIGDRPFMKNVIGLIFFNKLEKLSLKTKPKTEAIKEFNEKYNI